MMTVLVAIEQISNLQEEIILPKHIFRDLLEENASVAGFLPNEKLTVEDLLYGSMLPSGAEASLGLAEYVAGSERGFVKLMNEKAQPRHEKYALCEYNWTPPFRSLYNCKGYVFTFTIRLNKR